MVRVGNTVVCLRRHGASGPWIVENRYPNPDHAFPQFGPTLQVGVTAYTDFDSVTAYEAGGPQTQFHAISDYIGIPEGERARILMPKRAIAVSCPVRMDDGRVEVFQGYRVQHHLTLGPTKRIRSSYFHRTVKGASTL